MLVGGDDVDVLDGGGGRAGDYLMGGRGNDVFIFNRGYGNTFIAMLSPDAEGIDTLQLGAGITPAMLRITGSRNYARIGFRDTSAETIFLDGTPESSLRLQFADGSLYSFRVGASDASAGTLTRISGATARATASADAGHGVVAAQARALLNLGQSMAAFGAPAGEGTAFAASGAPATPVLAAGLV